jgi:WD40 repeat protein
LHAAQAAHEPPAAGGRGRGRTVAPPPVSVTCVAFLQDSGALATGGDRDSTVRLWDARNLQEPTARGPARRMRAMPAAQRLIARNSFSVLARRRWRKRSVA